MGPRLARLRMAWIGWRMGSIDFDFDEDFDFDWEEATADMDGVQRNQGARKSDGMITTSEQVFMAGIGGMGMAPLAIFLKESGYAVTGFDDNPRPDVLACLQAHGIALADRPDAFERGCKLVYSSAIKEDHPSRVAARMLNCEAIRRGEMLADITRGREVVAIAGSHGKTTTAGMLIHSLLASGFEFGYILGGLFADGGPSPAAFSENGPIVIEVDESDGTIERFNPTVTIAVNLDWDHPDFYVSREALEATFDRLCQRTKKAVFFPRDDRALARFASRSVAACLSFGRAGSYDLRATQNTPGGGLTVELGGDFPFAKAEVRAIGRFNALNACAALAAAHHLGAPVSADALATFPGIRRRQAVLYSTETLRVLEDYAHHPREVAELLTHLRDAFPHRKLVAVFQSHRFSRTGSYRKQFAQALSIADAVFLKETYGAGEAPTREGSAEAIFAELPRRVLASICPNHEALLHEIRPFTEEPSLIAFIGAGDIENWAHATADALRKRDMPEAPATDIAESTLPTLVAPYVSTAGRVEILERYLRATLFPESRLLANETLADKTTLRVGGPADLFVEPATSEDLAATLATGDRLGVPTFILGRGSNLVVPDNGFRGIVIRLRGRAWSQVQTFSDGSFFAGAGVRLKHLCAEAARNGMPGFSFLEGIPGSVGGSLRMNAGAMGGWMIDVVDRIFLMTPAGELFTRTAKQLNAGYRSCPGMDGMIALGASLKPSTVTTAETNTDAIRQEIESFAAKRKASQPRGASAGCMFKNPAESTPAGKLIDEIGLKGMRIGDAVVSPIHANFIVNEGKATAADIFMLVRNIRQRVHDEIGIDLDPEPLLLGQPWEDVL